MNTYKIKRILRSLIIIILFCILVYDNYIKPQDSTLIEAPVQEQVELETIQAFQSGEEIKWNGETIPAYSGQPYVAIHNNVPFFDTESKTLIEFEEYSPLDNLGRCGVAYANICKALMPTESRESIRDVKPSGWNNVPYKGLVEGDYLYNRCHLIGFQLAGENANPQNLITGTRYLNVQGMLPFENMVADYVKETGNHVLYRVTPVFVGDELVARGVVIEAEDVEEDGEDILFCVFAYNVQPGIEINYKDGSSRLIKGE